jgi:putative hydroxymethylpyrimidine transporter CytX
MGSSERTWGVTPVPTRLRTLTFADLGLLWGNLGVSLLVLVAGALLVPALGLAEALGAIAVGSVLGCALLGVAGLIGARRRLPGMVLLRDPLGVRGSYLPTVLNVAQNLGWATFELIVIAAAANALAERAFGFDQRWVWVLAAAALTTGLALAGPISFVRRYVRRIAVWIVVASTAYLTWWAVDRADVGALWSQSGEGGLTFWQGVDLAIAMAASWLPLAADYTRFARTGRGAFWGTALGYLVPLIWMLGLGALLALAFGAEFTDPTTVLSGVAAGGAASAVALLALTFDETDEPFANVYSAALSLQNLLPRASQRVLILVVAGAATVLALTVELGRYQDFLFLLGSFFVPLFGVLAADAVLGVARAVAWRASGLAAWFGGFAVYQLLLPTGPGWWLDLLDGVSGGWGTVGASLPAFAASFALYATLRALPDLGPLRRAAPR